MPPPMPSFISVPVVLFASAAFVPPMVPPVMVTIVGVVPEFCAKIAPPYTFASLPLRVQLVMLTVAPSA